MLPLVTHPRTHHQLYALYVPIARLYISLSSSGSIRSSTTSYTSSSQDLSPPLLNLPNPIRKGDSDGLNCHLIYRDIHTNKFVLVQAREIFLWMTHTYVSVTSTMLSTYRRAFCLFRLLLIPGVNNTCMIHTYAEHSTSE